MPLRKEPPTPRSAAVIARLDPAQNAASSSSSDLGPLIPFKLGQTSLRMQVILTEDEYISALSSIIKRDFFPSLDRLTAENEYLSAVEAEDPERIRVALDRLLRFDGGIAAQPSRKHWRKDVPRSTPKDESGREEWDDTPTVSGSCSRIFHPTFTPAASTPGLDVNRGERAEDEDPEPESGITPSPDLSLADFQARYTSEDNASFSQLLDRDNQLRKRKRAHLFAREQASEQRRKQIAHVEQADANKGKQLSIEANPDHPKLLEQGKRPQLIVASKGKETAVDSKSGGNSETAAMDNLILVPEPRKDDRPAPVGLNRWKYTARNALIYGPDANDSYLHARAAPPPSITPPVDEDNTKPTTNLSAIRLPELEDSAIGLGAEREECEAAWSPSSSRADTAIQCRRAGSIASSLDSGRAAGLDTPKVNGYGFVTPYSTPIHNNADEMHLRIYNAIKAKRRTSALGSTLSGADDWKGKGGGGRVFELPRLDRREELAQRLVSAASPKTKSGGLTPYGVQKYTGWAGLRERGFASPKSARRNVGELTPAARALLARSSRVSLTPSTGFASPASKRDGQDGSGSKSAVGKRGWTPTPQHTQRKLS